MIRDSRITFDEESHEYTVDMQTKVPWSVSKFVHMCTRAFDPECVLDTYYCEEWAHKKGYVDDSGVALSRTDIAERWHRNGTIQSRRGTLMHWHIECHLNGYWVCTPRSPEFEMFLVFKRTFLDALGLVVLRSELSMFHCGLRLAGQADCICRDAHGDFVILDWKRCREVRLHGFQDARQSKPLDHLPDCNFSVYSLQLNAYRHILETEYAVKVSGMYLVNLHPGQRPCGPHVYNVDMMRAEIHMLGKLASDRYGVDVASFSGEDANFDIEGLRFGHADSALGSGCVL